MDEVPLRKQWPYSQLNTSISCLTYGINCLFFDRQSNKLRSCLLSIHEEYINIIHVIVEEKASFLFELQNVKNISDKDIYIKQTLKTLGYEYFIIIYTSALESYVLVMPSQNEINVLWEGLQYFVYEANNFYSRISLMDPFKAESAMLFMDADVDGSKLLDIDEVLYIFKKLRIKKDRKQIEQSIIEINNDLYIKQNLKKPKDFEITKLTTLGFEYILQFYSLKAGIAPLFTQFCPIFKFKHKKFKKTITDILKSQSKPLMSGIQFQQFLLKFLKQSKTQAQCIQLIKTFPVYDGEGKQIPEEVQFLSFHNFCNFVLSPTNCITDPQKMIVFHDMTLPITEYFIYSSCLVNNSKALIDSQLQLYEINLKKGARSIQISITSDKEDILVKNYINKKPLYLADVLKTIKNICFSFNPFPVILALECNFNVALTDKVTKIFKDELGQFLFIQRQKDSKEEEVLPSPLELRNKIILQLIGAKKIKEEESSFMKLITLTPTKVDFERKGQTCWDTCYMTVKDVIKHEQIEDKNLTDYCRKIMVRTLTHEGNVEGQNSDPMPMFRNGVQLTNINMQKEDENHYFVHSKFLENGGKDCGYLLKPHWMRANCLESLYASSFTKQTSLLKIKVYAGQKFVLTDTNSSHFTLKVFIKGNKIQEDSNKKFTSDPKTQGFYSDFEMECEFKIFCPDLATLVLSIVDEKDKVLSFRAIPYKLIREGLRTVELLGPGMELNSNSCLLVESTIVEESRKRKLSSLLVMN